MPLTVYWVCRQILISESDPPESSVRLFESTGLVGHSTIRRVALETGKVLHAPWYETENAQQGAA